MSTASRAIDPSTGQPFKAPSATERFVGWMWSKYSRKVLLKIGVVTAPIIGMVSAHFGNTPSAQEAIGIGLSALVLGLLDFVVSYVGKRLGYTNLESLQKLSEEQEPIRPQPAIPFTSNSGASFTRSAMFESILAQKLPSPELEEFRASLRPLNPVPVMPSDEEIEATRGKIHGFSLEVDGAIEEFSTRTLMLMARNQYKADGKAVTVLG